MRLKTLAAVLFALAVAVSVAYFSSQNSELLASRFWLTPATSVPLWGALVSVFLAGFLPAVSFLVLESVKRDLAERRERRLAREAESLKGSFRRAVDLQADEQWERAAAELESVQAERPEDFETLLRYGQVLRRQGRHEEALEVHRRASVLYPQSVAVLHELAADYAVRGEVDVADQVRERILRDFPGYGRAELARRQIEALEAGDFAAASELQERLEGLPGGEPGGPAQESLNKGLRYERGKALLAAGRPAEAQAVFEGLLDDDPEFLPAALRLGEAFDAEGDADRALEIWRAGFDATGSPVLLQRIEDHFIEKADPLGALETLHRIIAASLSEVLPRFFLGRLYHRLEMHEEALRTLTELADRIESSPTYHYLLGRLSERRGETESALRAYKTSLQQAGVVTAEYSCSICETRRESWRDRCELCGCWGTIDLDFEEEVSPDLLGLTRPVVWDIEEEPL